MVPAPKRVDAVSFVNTTGHKLAVKVTYDDHKDKKEIVEEYSVDPGATHLFAEKELDMGSWQAVAPITRVAVSHGGRDHVLQPSVQGVVKLLKVSASEAGGGVTLKQEH